MSRAFKRALIAAAERTLIEVGVVGLVVLLSAAGLRAKLRGHA